MKTMRSADVSEKGVRVPIITAGRSCLRFSDATGYDADRWMAWLDSLPMEEGRRKRQQFLSASASVPIRVMSDFDFPKGR